MPPTPSRRTVADLGEFDVIQLLKTTISGCNLAPPYGIGDDAAVLPPNPGHEYVISKDLLIEGIHFDRRISTFTDIGYKAAAVNVSDIAAMGGTPLFLLVGLAIPPSLPLTQVRALYQGLRKLCKQHDIKIIGGDTCASRKDVIISLTILGTVKRHHVLSRTGAKHGDLIYVTGTLGDSGAGLHLLQHQSKRFARQVPQTVVRFLKKRHLQPSPRIHLGQLLAKHQLATAAIDLSDGLSGDLTHLCRASKVGAMIDMEQIPISRPCSIYLQTHKSIAQDQVLHWGEDYELLFTIPSRKRPQLEKFIAQVGHGITHIGRICPQRHGLSVHRQDGSSYPLIPESYTHFHD